MAIDHAGNGMAPPRFGITGSIVEDKPTQELNFHVCSQWAR